MTSSEKKIIFEAVIIASKLIDELGLTEQFNEYKLEKQYDEVQKKKKAQLTMKEHSDFISASTQLPEDGQQVTICFDSVVGRQIVDAEYRVIEGRGTFLYCGYPITVCSWKAREKNNV